MSAAPRVAFDVVIPARYGAERLPGKPLLDIAGSTLIERVYRCARASGAASVIVATDDTRIAAEVERFGGRVCLTASHHACGTDRIAEAVEKMDLPTERIVINLQGDEPRMPAALIEQVAACLDSHPDACVATACEPIEEARVYRDPAVVKVVCDDAGYALYFSRAPIPWERDRAAQAQTAPRLAYRHIGLYAYRAGYLREFAAGPPGDLERLERLEQLRVLARGERIAVCVACERPGPGVDTEDDLRRVRELFGGGPAAKV